VLIAKTPYEYRIENPSKKTITLIFRLDGYKEAKEQVELRGRQQVEALLELDGVDDPDPVDDKLKPTKRSRRRTKRRSKRRTKTSVTPKVVDPDQQPKTPPTKTPKRRPKSGKPKKINKTDQVDPFAQ
jgi:hypothetical protein